MARISVESSITKVENLLAGIDETPADRRRLYARQIRDRESLARPSVRVGSTWWLLDPGSNGTSWIECSCWKLFVETCVPRARHS